MRGKFVTIQRDTLRSQVVNALRSAIVEGALAPGEKLVERQLCEWFSVSRTSIREALRQLETEGWIVTTPFHGPSVRTLSLNDVVDRYQVRAALESYAVAQYCRCATTEHDDALRRALADMSNAVEQAFAEGQSAAVREFYAAVLTPLGNPRIDEALSEQASWLGWLRRTALSNQSGARHSFEEKLELYGALIARDEARARRACEIHLERACERVRQALVERLSEIDAGDTAAGAA